MWFINENRQIPNNRYFVFVSDNSSLVTATATALQKRIEVTYKNLSATDAGFIGNGTTFLSLLQNSGISEVDAKLRVTDIVVLGGRQDLQKGVANVKPAMETFSNYCKQHFPLAKVWVGMTGWADCGLASSSVVNIGIFFKDVLEYYCHACEYGMVYMNNVQYATHYTDFYSDTYTLNSTGLAYVGARVAECLLNGTTTVHESMSATMSYRSGCSAIDNTRVMTAINNNEVSLYLRNGSSNYCGFYIPNQTLTPKSYYAPVPVADLTGVWCTGRVNEYPPLASEWQYVLKSGSTSLEYECRLVMQGRTLCVQIRYFGTSSANFSLVRFAEPIKITSDAMFC